MKKTQTYSLEVFTVPKVITKLVIQNITKLVGGCTIIEGKGAWFNQNSVVTEPCVILKICNVPLVEVNGIKHIILVSAREHNETCVLFNLVNSVSDFIYTKNYFKGE